MELKRCLCRGKRFSFSGINNMKENEKASCENKEIDLRRRAKRLKLKHLGDYKKGYNRDRFIKDLVKYFEGEVDFDLDKISKELEKPGKLSRLVDKAKEKNTHPVTEFVEELFKDLTSQDQTK